MTGVGRMKQVADQIISEEVYGVSVHATDETQNAENGQILWTEHCQKSFVKMFFWMNHVVSCDWLVLKKEWERMGWCKNTQEKSFCFWKC